MGRRKNGQGGLSHRKDGRWEARVVIGYDEKGLPKTKNVLAKTKSECLEKLEKLKASITVEQKPKYDGKMLFGDWMDFWFREFCSPRLKDSTRQTYSYRIYKQVIPNIGKIPLKDLKTSDIQSFYAMLKKDGRLIRRETEGTGVSDSHIRSIHAHVNAALNKAVAEGLIFRNPASDCRLSPKRNKEIQVLTHAEMHRLFIQAKEEGFFEMIFLDLSTGIRRGELVGLQWDDVDFEKGELHIKRQVDRVNGELIVTTLKTKNSVRTIKLSELAMLVLSEYKKRANSKWLFPSPLDSEKPREPSACRKRLSGMLEHAECKHVRFHDLRHTFATMAVENGIDFKTLADILGHSTAATSINTYTHLTDEMQRASAINIDRRIAHVEPKESEKTSTKDNTESSCFEEFVPYKGKKRKPGTGGIYHITPNCWQGRYTPTLGGRRTPMNVYAPTEEECEAKLAELIAKVKAETGRA